jgi:hypothetical protein
MKEMDKPNPKGAASEQQNLPQNDLLGSAINSLFTNIATIVHSQLQVKILEGITHMFHKSCDLILN